MPFSDATFNVVLSTVMLHHLPDEARHQGIRNPTGLEARWPLLAVDFGGSEPERHSRIARHRNHANFDIRQLIPELNEAGLHEITSGKVGFRDCGSSAQARRRGDIYR